MSTFSQRLLMYLLSSKISQYNKSINADATASLDQIKLKARQEILKVGSRILIGTILVSLIILCLIKTIEYIQEFLSLYEYGIFYEFTAFLTIIILSSLGLYFLFQNNDGSEKKQGTDTTSRGVNLEILVSQFFEGFFEGVQKTKVSYKKGEDDKLEF